MDAHYETCHLLAEVFDIEVVRGRCATCKILDPKWVRWDSLEVKTLFSDMKLQTGPSNKSSN